MNWGNSWTRTRREQTFDLGGIAKSRLEEHVIESEEEELATNRNLGSQRMELVDQYSHSNRRRGDAEMRMIPDPVRDVSAKKGVTK